MKPPGESALRKAARLLFPWGARRGDQSIEHLNRILTEENARLKEAAKSAGQWPPGHFYSPIPSKEDIRIGLSCSNGRLDFPGIDLRTDAQRALLEQLAEYYPRLNFPRVPAPDFRFYLQNPSYGEYDAVLFACMVLHFKPARIIEVGSGFSSALMLDLNERFFGGGISLTMIEPHTERLLAIMRPGDSARAGVIERKVQDAPLDCFRTLQRGDILFIDSSHVSKVGSDVNHIVFQVLPILAPGVLVHFHDVSGNFEYPEDWLADGRAWNEMYLLRAFLMHNSAFEVLILSPQLRELNREFLRERMPLCLNGGGGQIWIRRTDEA